MIRSPATLRALILPVSRYSTMSGAISVESMRTRTGASVSLRIWCAALLAARERDDVALAQLLLALVRAQRRLAAEDDRPFLVRVVGVKRPLLVTRLDLVHARANQLGVGVRTDPGVLEAPAFSIFRAIPFVCVEIEDLHAASLVALSDVNGDTLSRAPSSAEPHPRAQRERPTVTASPVGEVRSCCLCASSSPGHARLARRRGC